MHRVVILEDINEEDEIKHNYACKNRCVDQYST